LLSDLSQWTAAEVSEFLRERGLSERIQCLYKKNHIKGSHLLNQERKDMEQLGLNSVEQSQLVLEITKLKEQLHKQEESKTSMDCVMMLCYVLLVSKRVYALFCMFRHSYLH